MENNEILKIIEEEKSLRRWSSGSDEENNWAGKTPLDIFFSGEKVDFGEDWNSKRNVTEI